MKRAVLGFIFSILGVMTSYAQLSAPNVEAVYGGRILGITGYALTADSSRIFISTESANSLFYADILTSSAIPPAITFNALPSVDANDDYGSGVQLIKAHSSSGYLFFAHNTEGLMKTTISATTPDAVTSGFIADMQFVGDTLIYLNANQIHALTVDGAGNTTPYLSNISTGVVGPQQKLDVHPIDGTIYVFAQGTAPQLYKSGDNLAGLTSGTSFSDISPSLSTSVTWKAMGIAPSGRIFIFGDDQLDKYVAYSDDEITWTTNSISGGVAGGVVDFSGDSTSYNVYFAKLYNHNNGEGAWTTFGNVSQETHPNDGGVLVDPVNEDFVYITTDQGIGMSLDAGPNIFEINNGVEAVQVQDFDMTASKNIGWMASKSGVRQVTDFLTAPSWSNALFPQGDGSPYFSIEIDPSDSSFVYAGNVRVYRTVNDGGNWNRLFTPEVAPYNFTGIGTRATAIEVSPYDPNLILASYSVQDTLKGGLFVSYDRGANWSQILIEATVEGYDVDLNDVIFTIEDSDTVVYVGAEYDLDDPQGRSVYRLVKNGTSWAVAQDMNSGGTSTGSLIVASIWDMEMSFTGDTLYAVGTDAGINHPITYYKALNADELWTPLSVSGFPFEEGKTATAASIGGDTLFVGVDNEVYYLKAGDSAWQLGYSYPVGTEINVLYYDELLVGTGTGMFAHFTPGTFVANEEEKEITEDFRLHQNYPNPFNPATNITFELPVATQVQLRVYNLLGQKVSELVNGKMNQGVHTVRFDASGLASGMYIYRLETGQAVLSRKMLLIK